MKNFTNEAKRIINNLKSKGIKPTDIDFITEYSQYYTSQQIRNNNVSEEHFTKIKNFYDDFLKNPENYKNISKKAKKFFMDQKIQGASENGLNEESMPPFSVASLIEHQNRILQTISEQAKIINKSTETTTGVLQFLNDSVSRQLDMLLTNSNTLLTNSKDMLARATGLFLKGEAVSTVALHSLARLEKKPEASLVYEADKMFAALSEKSMQQSNIAAEHT